MASKDRKVIKSYDLELGRGESYVRGHTTRRGTYMSFEDARVALAANLLEEINGCIEVLRIAEHSRTLEEFSHHFEYGVPLTAAGDNPPEGGAGSSTGPI